MRPPAVKNIDMTTPCTVYGPRFGRLAINFRWTSCIGNEGCEGLGENPENFYIYPLARDFL